MKKPNIVIIMADQLRFDALGEHTPHINQLAKEGVSFQRAYCASPLCVPARGAFFTGTYPNVNGSIINPWDKQDAKHGDVKRGTPNLYGMMEEAWDSHHTGKQHLYTEGGKLEKDPLSKTNWVTTQETYGDYLRNAGKKGPGGKAFLGKVAEMSGGRITKIKHYSIPKTGCYQEGFDFFYDGYFANGAIKAIEERDKEKPFLLNAMFLAPHPPLDIPQPYYSMMEEEDMPENVGLWSKDQSPLQMYNLTGILGTRYAREDWKEVWRVYKGLVKLLDDCVGMIVKKLKSEGMYDNTLILFTSDHGEMLGSHCLFQKMCMYEEASRIPLYIKFPKDYKPKVKESEELVSAIDVLPTLCEYLDLPKPKVLSGVSLMPIIEGKRLERDEIFIQFDGNGARGNFQRCVIRGEYKLIVDMFKDEYFLELYHVVKDSQELINLAFDEQYKALINSMLDSLRKHMSDTNDLLSIPKYTYTNFIKDYSIYHEQ